MVSLSMGKLVSLILVLLVVVFILVFLLPLVTDSSNSLINWNPFASP